MLRQSSRSRDERVVIAWKDIKFHTLTKDPVNSTPIKTAYKSKEVLKGLSGRAESSELLAILGPTGCGKTSLLNVLAARFPSGGSSNFNLTGSIMVNGKPRDEQQFRNISAYVLQDDHMFTYLTIFESLLLAANFFLPGNLTDEAKIDLVNSVITELGLIKARDTIIGNDKVRGVSGGERKRASIAVQLLSDPAVLFLDEPTSGLDAFQSLAVMESMKNLADHGRLVISVIHQPRSSIFDMFDKLLVLSEGSTMYYGDAKNVVSYFTKHGYICPEVFNPSDFLLDLLSPDNRSKDSESETKNRIKFLEACWIKQQEETASAVLVNENLSLTNIQIIGSSKQDFRKVYRAMCLLCWRCWVEQSRNIPVICTKFTFAIAFSLIIGGIYSNVGNSQKSIQNRKGILFFIVINQGFNSILAVLGSFPREKTLVSRERSANAYTTLSYCVAKIFVEMPLNLMPVLVYCCICHPLIGLNPNTFGLFILICMIANVVCVCLGLAISSIAPNPDIAQTLGPVFVIIGVLFGGFYIKIDSLPIILNWFPYMSLFRWSYEALCINDFSGLTFTCETVPEQCLLTGEAVLDTMGYGGHTTSSAVFGLGMVMLGYLSVLYVLLEFNRIVFVPLGFTGRAFSKISSSVISSHHKRDAEYELVPRQDSNEVSKNDHEKRPVEAI